MTPLRIAQVTDTHLYADPDRCRKGVNTTTTGQQVFEQLQGDRPDFLLLTGDLSQDESWESYERLRGWITDFGVPAAWVPGNHDEPDRLAQVCSAAPFQTDRHLQLGGWSLLLLDSQLRGEVHGEVAADQLDWLAQELAQTGDRPVLIGLHHPPLPTGTPWLDTINVRNWPEVQECLRTCPNVKLVVFGHIHQDFLAEDAGITYLGTPSTNVQFAVGTPDFAIDAQPPGWRWLELWPDGRWQTRVERLS